MSDQLKAPKAPRRKVTTDLGRQIMQRERQRLAREQAALGEQLADEARRALARRDVHRHTVKPELVGVQRGIMKRIAAVLQTEGVTARIHANESQTMSAWTDFDQIVINYRMHEDVRMLAATMRALAYHEGGHCRFTVPFRQLVELAVGSYDRAVHAQYHKAWNMLEDQRMETAVVSDSPRKAAYLTPMIMTEMTDTVSSAAANWPILIWRKYLPRKIRTGARKLFVAQHNLQGIDGEALAKAWEQVVTEYVLADNAPAMFASIIAAHQLLQSTQTVPAAEGDMGHGHQQHGTKEDLDDALVIPIDPSMIEEAEGCFPTDEEDLPEVDIDTTDPEVAEHLSNVLTALFTCPETLLRVIYAVIQESEQTNEGGSAPAGDPDADADDDTSDEDEADADEQQEGVEDADDADGSSDDESDEDDGSCSFPGGSMDDDDDDDERHANDGERKSGVDPEQEGGSEHSDNDPVDDDLDYTDRSDDEDDDELTDEDLEEALNDAEAERDEDEALDADMRAFHDVIDNRVSDLMPYITHPSNDLEAAAAAHNLADELEQSFYASTADSAPAWVEQQKRGVINVLRYVTRQPGDMEFFRQWTDDDQPGFNIAVSVMLDYSASMSGYTEELAQAGYAAKLACSKLDIPCTVTLWDTEAVVLWDANETADYLPVVESNGGTDPSFALADLPNQRYEKAQHIVLIMTDGEWYGNQSNNGYLAAYNEQGRLFIGCGFNSGYGASDMLADKLRRYGCDESYAIKSLMEIPRLLEQTLAAIA